MHMGLQQQQRCCGMNVLLGSGMQGMTIQHIDTDHLVIGDFNCGYR
jgi:endonuclease/exonuclease/phosphatase family metal-dependent hydrolase